MTLVEFLLARIAEDEEAAEAAGGHWHLGRYFPDSTEIEDEAGEIVVYDESAPRELQAQHIVRWDPARVLAECESKRQVVRAHESRSEQGNHRGGEVIGYHATGLGIAIRLLALPYADHPDYREEWRP